MLLYIVIFCWILLECLIIVNIQNNKILKTKEIVNTFENMPQNIHQSSNYYNIV